METIKVEITEEMLQNIQHVCTWYQGRDVDKCNAVEEWAMETLDKKKMEIEFIKIAQKFKEQQRAWHAQFKEGDVWKPKAWKCKKKGQKWCEYEPYDDPACDGCIHCHQPYERK